MVVVTDVNEDRLARAEALFPPAEVKEKDGIDLHFVNTGKMENPAAKLREMTGGTGFDDVFCYAPVAAVIELCSAVPGRDYAQSAKDSGRQKRCCNSEKTLSVVGTDRVSLGVKVRYSAHTPIRRQYLYIAPRKSEQKLLTESENKKNRALQAHFFFPCINSEIHALGIYEFAPQILFYACCRTKYESRKSPAKAGLFLVYEVNEIGNAK